MKILKTKFNKKYVKEAVYILPFVVYSNTFYSGKQLWFGWLKWLFAINLSANKSNF